MYVLFECLSFKEAETAKALRAFRKGGAKVAKFYHQYSKEGKDLRFRKELQGI